MTTIVSTPSVSPPLPRVEPTQVNQREDKHFAAAHRHTKMVGLLKKALPVSALAVISIFIASIFLSSSPFGNISIEGADFENGMLIMKSPTMAGFDSKNRPYDVKAQRAIQDPASPAIITLENINALLPIDGENKARILAAKGTYDSEKETMVLEDEIVVTGARGMEIKMQSADIDIKTGTLNSANPVSVRSSDAEITADTVQVRDNGANIVFKDRVRMTIQPSALRGTNSDQ